MHLDIIQHPSGLAG